MLVTGRPRLGWWNPGFCQLVVQRPPWGSSGSVLAICIYLHRIHRRSGQPYSRYSAALTRIATSLAAQALLKLWIAPSSGACGVGAGPTFDKTHRMSGRRSIPQITDLFGFEASRGALMTVKYDNYPRALSNRYIGLVGPHPTPPILNCKYMTPAS